MPFSLKVAVNTQSQLKIGEIFVPTVIAHSFTPEFGHAHKARTSALTSDFFSVDNFSSGKILFFFFSSSVQVPLMGFMNSKITKMLDRIF